ncbi:MULTISPECIES: hypothetical protein [Pseudomonas syringae group]|uniref:Uncharacterized protein n=1 Tax=Pseudomonas syringae pv. japonica str. M301072 TaxID=629262 RepID=F3FH95_PSESX|nr:MULTISPECIES: hypothetical protein [Pseudomonas syringae group]EGH29581.1 hypothetical protein PSYJA_11605 [Pseudomonas syringae pv. japonica str. M301072]
MERPYDDFQFIKSLVTKFVGRKSFESALCVIGANQITGWEVWFQVEFARFLAEHEDQPEWKREVRFEFDYRREKHGWYLKPDFLIRKKGAAVDRFIALEIKQHTQLGNCLSNMISDLAKVRRIRRSAVDLRSYWALGVFQAADDDDIDGAIEAKLAEHDLPAHWGLMTHDKIGKTGFSFALLSGVAF